MKTVDWLTCEETIRRLDDYLDRALTPRERAEVGAHLEVCGACARAYGMQERFVEEVRGKVNRIAAPPALRERVTALLREARSREEAGAEAGDAGRGEGPAGEG